MEKIYFIFRRFSQGRGNRVGGLSLLFALFTAMALLPSGVNAMGVKHKAEALISGYTVIDGFSSPESVTTDGRLFYVSNVGVKLAPSAKDGDGFISSLTPDGRLLERRFITGLNAPKGMGIIDGVLYVADIDKIVGFDLKSRKPVFSLDFSAEGTKSLNDITVVDSTTLLVSATDIGEVYAVTLGKHKRYTRMLIEIKGVNGLAFDAEHYRLFIVNFVDGKGALRVIPFKHGPGELQNLTGPVGMLDGVALLPGGRVLFSDWVKFGSPGRLYLFDILSGKTKSVELKEAVKGPADFYYDKVRKKIWIPAMVEGRVMIQNFK